MTEKLDLRNSLDLSPKDLTKPNVVIQEILDQLPKETEDIIKGNIVEYDGLTTSYTSQTVLSETLGALTTKSVDIQDFLGEQGWEENKYECYLYTPAYEKYKYRLFFLTYGLAIYPVQFTLEESIARSIQGASYNYIVNCDSREEVERLVLQIMACPKVIKVMQELINIYHSKK